MRKQHAQHGRDHRRYGADPIRLEKNMLVKLSPDAHTPFTVIGTDEYTDALVVLYVTPDMDGWYLTDAQAFVSNPTVTGDVLVSLENDTQNYYMLGNGTTAESLVVDEGLSVGHVASTDAILTTVQLAAGDAVGIYSTQTDGAARGLTVWLEFGPSPADGANAPTST